MFLGVETSTWSVHDFLVESQYLHAQGIDTILVKVSDGGNLWYGGYGGIDNVLAAIRDGGCAVIPYIYSYGDKFSYLDGEAAIVNQLLSQGYDVCMDMEVEWNGQVAWAQRIVGMLSRPIYISTWADPDLQNWDQILTVLAAKTIKFMPQVYTTWLQSNWHTEFSDQGISNEKIIITISSGALDAAKGWPSVAMWEATTLSKSNVQEVIKSLSTTINPDQKKQGEFVWSLGPNCKTGTGIYDTWIGLYTGQIGNYGAINLGSPTKEEEDSNDWNGVPCRYMEFKFGHMEWYSADGAGHRAGEHHVWYLGQKLF
jgi:hypothetical protein